jgi:hypothetical protein
MGGLNDSSPSFEGESKRSEYGVPAKTKFCGVKILSYKPIPPPFIREG